MNGLKPWAYLLFGLTLGFILGLLAPRAHAVYTSIVRTENERILNELTLYIPCDRA